MQAKALVMDDELSVRWWQKVMPTDGCWHWVGAKSAEGYGKMCLWQGGIQKAYKAHRIGYEYLVGLVPEGMELDHICRNRLCVNPAHLEVVPHRVNTLRGESFSARNAVKTHCPRGHVLLPRSGNSRACRECSAERMRRHRAKQKEEKCSIALA